MELVSRDGQPVDGQREREREKRGNRERERAEKREGAWRSKVSFDQIRMGAISMTNCNFAGSHAGISIGEDGASQMALEDLAMFRTIPGASVFYPSDGVSAERAVELAANTPGVCFIRTSRPATETLYDADESFAVGKSKIVRSSPSDQVTIVAAGITLREAMRAASELAESDINVRVVDIFSVKPVDKDLLLKCSRETGGRFITVEDHYPEGGIGDAVAGALGEERGVVVKKLAVTGVPRSGKCDELLEMFGINYNAIKKAVKEVINL